jgi:hypothetical protein
MTVDHALMTRAASVWRALIVAYPGTFEAVYGSDPLPIWVAAIATLTDEQCRLGCTEIAKQAVGRTFPCNLTEFETACRSGSPSRPLQGRRPYEPDSPVARPEVRDRHLASIRAKLGMAP